MNGWTILVIVLTSSVLSAGGMYKYEHDELLLAVNNAKMQQLMVDSKKCSIDKQITKGATDALQKDRDDLTTRLADKLQQRPPACVSVARKADIQHKPAGPVQYNGLSSDWLYTYATNQCSSYWQQLKVCDKFLDDERKLKP